MSFLEELTKDVVSACSGDAGHANMVQSVMGLLNNPATGGLQGLVQQFEQNGLGNVVQSWIGTGPNQPINAAQIQQVLGNTQLGQLAQNCGVTPQEAASMLSSVLPALVDRLTPSGQMPPVGGSASFLEGGMNFLKQSGILGN
jgi:uncharacterized protein YidB (DUF937 family)